MDKFGFTSSRAIVGVVGDNTVTCPGNKFSEPIGDLAVDRT